MYHVFFFGGGLFRLDGSHLVSSHAAFDSAAACEEKDVFVPLHVFLFFCWLVFYWIARHIFSMSINDSQPEIRPFFFSHGGGLFCKRLVDAA